MKQHCKGCVFHHNPQHKAEGLKKYNDWCCSTGNFASKSIGHCKLNNLKRTK